jgi:hypothetical protein
VDGMGVEISSGKVGQVGGVALPGTLLRPLYAAEQTAEIRNEAALRSD